jgi:hypothetical protein
MKRWKEYSKVNVEVNNIEYDVEVVGLFIKYKDGEDADGNRGWWATDLEDVLIESIEPTPSAVDLEIVTKAVYDLGEEDFNWDGVGEEDED